MAHSLRANSSPHSEHTSVQSSWPQRPTIPRKWAGGRIQQNDRDDTSSLCGRPPMRLRHFCWTPDLCVQHVSTPVHQRHLLLFLSCHATPLGRRHLMALQFFRRTRIFRQIPKNYERNISHASKPYMRRLTQNSLYHSVSTSATITTTIRDVWNLWILVRTTCFHQKNRNWMPLHEEMLKDCPQKLTISLYQTQRDLCSCTSWRAHINHRRERHTLNGILPASRTSPWEGPLRYLHHIVLSPLRSKPKNRTLGRPRQSVPETASSDMKPRTYNYDTKFDGMDIHPQKTLSNRLIISPSLPSLVIGRENQKVHNKEGSDTRCIRAYLLRYSWWYNWYMCRLRYN